VKERNFVTWSAVACLMVCGTDKSNLVSVVILNKETMSKMCMWCPEGVFLSYTMKHQAFL